MIQDLTGDVVAELDDLLAPLSKRFEDTAAYFDWLAGLTAGFATGKYRALAEAGPKPVSAALLYAAGEGLATILTAVGDVNDGFLLGAIAHLQSQFDALIWDESVGAGWAGRLASLGVHPYELQTRVQELARVAIYGQPTELEISSWTPEDAVEAQELLIAANTGTLAGLFLTYPSAPSRAAYLAGFERLIRGDLGTFNPDISCVARLEGRLAGVCLAVVNEPGRALLFELATHPRARGRQVGRHLVATMQRAMLAHGLSHLVFITTADNAAVHRLYTDDEIVEQSAARGGYWMRGMG